MIIIEEKFQKTTEKQIAKFEVKKSIKLPKDYRQFLLEYNGGRPMEYEFKISKNNSDTVIFFLGLGVKKNHPNYDLETNLIVYKNRMPSELLPIADDPFGNKICLSIKGKKRGKIYLWWHEDEADETDCQPYWKNISEIANNFTEFISLFKNP